MLLIRVYKVTRSGVMFLKDLRPSQRMRARGTVTEYVVPTNYPI